MYYLVTLVETASDPAAAAKHERFIDSLIARQLILLGGPFDGQPWPGLSAAYVLRCASSREANDLAATDPLVIADAATATVTRWDLIGIDLRAIDFTLTVDT